MKTKQAECAAARELQQDVQQATVQCAMARTEEDIGARSPSRNAACQFLRVVMPLREVRLFRSHVPLARRHCARTAPAETAERASQTKSWTS